MLALLLAVHAATGPGPGPVLHYRIVNRSTVDAGPGTTPLVLTMSAFVEISVTDSASGQVANVTVRWSRFDAGVMATSLPPQLLEDATGMTLRGFAVNGRTASVAVAAENLQAMQLVSAIQLLLAGTRSARDGERWIDSTSADTAVVTAASTTLLVTRWAANRTAGGKVQFDGTATGTTTLAAGAMQLALQTSGTSHLAVADGQLPLTVTSVASGQGTMSLGAAAVPVKVRTEVSATRFRTEAWAEIP